MIVENYFNIFTCEQHQLEYSNTEFRWVTFDEDNNCVRNMRGDKQIRRMFFAEARAYRDKERRC